MRYIVAESLMHARNTAEVDLGWRALSRDKWKNDKNELVIYLPKQDDLRGTRNGTIYLGYNWYKNKELTNLEAIANSQGYTLRSV